MTRIQDGITLETRGKIAIITLNRAEKLNSLDLKLHYRLSCLMREVAARNDICITVLTGKGRYFSAYGPPHPLGSHHTVIPALMDFRRI